MKLYHVSNFCSTIKFSLFYIQLRKRHITTQETPEHVDSGTNFEQSSLQNMWTQIKFDKKTWKLLDFDENTWNKLKFLYFYHHKAASVFLLPQFVFHLKFELSLKCTQRRLVYSNNHHRLPPLNPQPPPDAILHNRKSKIK